MNIYKNEKHKPSIFRSITMFSICTVEPTIAALTTSQDDFPQKDYYAADRIHIRQYHLYRWYERWEPSCHYSLVYEGQACTDILLPIHYSSTQRTKGTNHKRLSDKEMSVCLDGYNLNHPLTIFFLSNNSLRDFRLSYSMVVWRTSTGLLQQVLHICNLSLHGANGWLSHCFIHNL